MTSNFLTFLNALIVVTNARSIVSPVSHRMNQYPGVNRHISAGLSKTFIGHFSMLHLSDSRQAAHWLACVKQEEQ